MNSSIHALHFWYLKGSPFRDYLSIRLRRSGTLLTRGPGNSFTPVSSCTNLSTPSVSTPVLSLLRLRFLSVRRRTSLRDTHRRRPGVLERSSVDGRDLYDPTRQYGYFRSRGDRNLHLFYKDRLGLNLVCQLQCNRRNTKEPYDVLSPFHSKPDVGGPVVSGPFSFSRKPEKI